MMINSNSWHYYENSTISRDTTLHSNSKWLYIVHKQVYIHVQAYRSRFTRKYPSSMNLSTLPTKMNSINMPSNIWPHPSVQELNTLHHQEQEQDAPNKQNSGYSEHALLIHVHAHAHQYSILIHSHFFSVNWWSRHDLPTPMSPTVMKEY